MKGIGIGESDFRGLITRDYYYIDKTMYIKSIIENAKKQIEEKKYEENLKERGFTNITRIVFAFKGKEVKMKVY